LLRFERIHYTQWDDGVSHEITRIFFDENKDESYVLVKGGAPICEKDNWSERVAITSKPADTGSTIAVSMIQTFNSQLEEINENEIQACINWSDKTVAKDNSRDCSVPGISISESMPMLCDLESTLAADIGALGPTPADSMEFTGETIGTIAPLKP